ncbi:MAG: hypothetical protein LUQ26_05325 [Methylococcaceae bacterium]|nr:hypothetical protein [Methylococcaceae bacterium]
MTEEEKKQAIKEINALTHEEMARLHRFAPTGHKFFASENNLYPEFMKRFDKLGGMTPYISKKVGWTNSGD